MFGRSRTNLVDAPLPSNGNGANPQAAEDDAIVPLWQPTQAVARKSVEQLLLERGHIEEAHLAQARQVASQTPGKTLAQILLQMNAATEAQILAALAETLNIEFEQPDRSQVDPAAFESLPPDYIRKQLVIPLRLTGEPGKQQTLVVGMADPTNVFLLDEVKRRVKRN